MPRKKQTKPTETVAVVNPEGQAVLDALRSNLNLLGELAVRYEGLHQAGRPGGPALHRPPPATFTTCWGRRCPSSPRSSFGCS